MARVIIVAVNMIVLIVMIRISHRHKYDGEQVAILRTKVILTRSWARFDASGSRRPPARSSEAVALLSTALYCETFCLASEKGNVDP